MMSDQVFVSQGNTWSNIIDVCIAHISYQNLQEKNQSILEIILNRVCESLD